MKFITTFQNVKKYIRCCYCNICQGTRFFSVQIFHFSTFTLEQCSKQLITNNFLRNKENVPN